MAMYVLRLKGTDHLYARKHTRHTGGNDYSFWLWRTTTDFERAQPFTSEARAKAGVKAWQEDYAWRKKLHRAREDSPDSLDIEVLEVELSVKRVVGEMYGDSNG